MKKHFFLALALAFTSVIIAFADQPNLPTQNGYPVVINFGFKDVATPTITINNAIVDLADYLPAGTIGFELRCASGSFVIGHPDNIATGTNRVGRLVSAGESYTWNGNANSFVGSVLGTASTTVIVLDAVWGQYER
ncbi:MAG TPA: hypothetical protein PKN29_13065 [Candidatus Ozemobacteraceae bacterium]|nr:hypothetical protein [Candidatus Ozemobacteraceae bacterium]